MKARVIFRFGPWQALWAAAISLGLLSASAQGQINYQQIKFFGWPQLASGSPTIPLIDGGDGYLYGPTIGGATLYGTIYKIGKNGEAYEAIHHFMATEGEPMGPLSLSRDGGFYGTTANGIFKFEKGGTSYSRVWSLEGGLFDETSAVLEGADGALYLTRRLGGSQQGGSILRVSSNGSSYNILHAFDETDPFHTSHPVGLLLGKDGSLYGITQLGGPFVNEALQSSGTVFKINEDGAGYTVLHTFGSQEDGSSPVSLIQGGDGSLYGTTATGGVGNGGTLFRMAPDGTGFRVLLSFGANGVFGRNPFGVSQGPDGFLYGTVSATAFRVDTNGGSYATLHQFFLENQDAPTITAGHDGVLYGTTATGGATGYGTIYSLTTNGNNYSLFYSALPSGGDASSPTAPLVESRTDTRLYGVSSSGGVENAGAMFTVQKDGTAYRVLHDFSSSRGDGAHPAGLIEGSDGVFYGTTWSGGTTNKGTVFCLTREGEAYTVLHSFGGGDGSNPVDGVTEGKDGKLYGTTPSGGTANLGVVFSLNKDGTGFSVLWNFTGGTNVLSSPQATVIQATNSALYGTATNGVFSLDSNLRFTVLHRFDGDETGLASHAKLLEASDGFLYGTAWGSKPAIAFKITKDGSTYQVLHAFSMEEGPDLFGSLVEGPAGAVYGVASGRASLGIPGAIFKVSKDGSGFQILHNFDPTTGGGYSPQTGLLLGSDTILYGVTVSGGGMGHGTIFRLSSSPFPVRITGLQMQPNGVILDLLGNPSQTYEIQATTGFPSGWTSLGSVMANSEGVVKFVDGKGQQQSNGFYRAQVQQ